MCWVFFGWVRGTAIHYWFPVLILILFLILFFTTPSLLIFPLCIVLALEAVLCWFTLLFPFCTLLHSVRVFFPPPWRGYFNYALFILIMRSFIMVLANCSIITLFLLCFANVQQIQRGRKCPQFYPSEKKTKKAREDSLLCCFLYFKKRWTCSSFLKGDMAITKGLSWAAWCNLESWR